MATGRNGRAQLGATAFARSDPVTKVATVPQSELPLAPSNRRRHRLHSKEDVRVRFYKFDTSAKTGGRIRRLLFSPPKGVWAEVKVGGEYLRLFSENSALGVQASVDNANTKTRIAPSEPVDDIETGKDCAAAHAAFASEGRTLGFRVPTRQ